MRGIPITDYCDQANLATVQRLDLFIQVCQAVQHAHQKGIIHRDLKPSNILVTLHDGVPVPKAIDFGIAKATEGRLTDATVYTQMHQLVGTRAYMSPEQAEMSRLDIDTRSDIHSLVGADPAQRCTFADSWSVFGSGCPERSRMGQARLFTRECAAWLMPLFTLGAEHHDQQTARLAALRWPLYYHAPSLVQHTGCISTWGGGGFHTAGDFVEDWAPG